VFHLALRQTDGFIACLIRLMNLDLASPDLTKLSRRNGTVAVPAQSANLTGVSSWLPIRPA
jgi:hypothetical protein